MLNDLYIQLPEDFEEQYVKYKAVLLDGKTEPVEKEIPTEVDKKYASVKEDITLKTLGIEIKGNYVSKGKGGFKINPTDRQLIDFLHYRFSEEKNWCSEIDVLEKELGKAKGTLKNRIGYINNEIRKIVSGDQKTNIDDFIKYESGRGYHLNSRFVIKFIKKK